MSRMEKTEPVHITSDIRRPFAAYTHLPVRQEMLSRETMRGIIGGKVVLPPGSPPPVLPGVAALGDGVKIAVTAGASLATSLTVKYSDQIWNGICYAARGVYHAGEAILGRFAEAFEDVWYYATR